MLAADIDEDRVAATASELGVAWAPVDVEDKGSVAAFASSARSQLGAVDILVCNAGRGEQPLDSFARRSRVGPDLFRQRARRVSLRAGVRQDMAERGKGCIVNMSSVSGRQGDAMLAHYSASKFAVIGFTQALARELGPYGVRANALCPGTVDTEMGRKLARGVGDDAWPSSPSAIRSSGRPVNPEEIGAAVVFLAAMPIITGQALNVDGGLVLS